MILVAQSFWPNFTCLNPGANELRNRYIFAQGTERKEERGLGEKFRKKNREKERNVGENTEKKEREREEQKLRGREEE